MKIKLKYHIQSEQLMEDIIGEKSPYLIHCVEDLEFGSCGASTYLTEEQYNKQIGIPNKGWSCPQCGCYPCNWDDNNS